MTKHLKFANTVTYIRKC